MLQIPESRDAFVGLVGEVAAVARGSGIPVAADLVDRIVTYTTGIPPTTRSSLLIDLSQGKRIEVESLPGSVVRRGRAAGVPTPMMAALYAVLKPHAKRCHAIGSVPSVTQSSRRTTEATHEAFP